MSSARPKIAARALALVEPDEVARECVVRALEGSQLEIVCRCASAAELNDRLLSGSEFALILVGTDEGSAASEPEVKRLRERFGEHRILSLALRKACRSILQAPSASDSARATAALARALVWVVLEQREQSPTAGRLEATRGAESPDMRSHIKGLLRGFRTPD